MAERDDLIHMPVMRWLYTIIWNLQFNIDLEQQNFVKEVFLAKILLGCRFLLRETRYKNILVLLRISSTVDQCAV